MNLANAGRVPYVHFTKRRDAQAPHTLERARAFEHPQGSTVDRRNTQSIRIGDRRGLLQIDNSYSQTGATHRTSLRQTGDTPTGYDDVIML